MILLPAAVRVFVATTPANLRCSFEGLSNAVRAQLLEDPLSGHLFVFINRRRNQVKLLLWTRGGFTILHKRLERGTFAFAQRPDLDPPRVEVAVHELSMLLEGIESADVRLRGRWSPPRASATTG